ncbi:MAG: putative toxin-antitoxin system toxin component, PIN family [Synergistaceae bacterium]|nr:putative toxin-antitoxin system toxin component, PIN family [Synergistaceae bacterium]
MKIYAVIDTNVLVSAMLKWSSVPGGIIASATNGIIVPVLSEGILREYRTVLARSKFHITRETVDDIIGRLEEYGEYITPEKLNADLPDPKDAVFYEVVMEKRKNEDAYLVTGNIKHFPHEYFVVTPREMLNILMDYYGPILRKILLKAEF